MKNYLQTLFEEKRTYSRFEALYYLRHLAAAEGNDFFVTTANLAQKWGSGEWNKRRVHAFLQELKEAGEIEVLSTGRNGTRIRFAVPVVAVKKAAAEVQEITPPPTLDQYLEKQRKEKAAEEAKPLPSFDFTKIDWTMADKVPSICLYRAYLDAFPAYAPKEEDMQALGRIVNFLKKAVELQRKQTGSISNLNVDLLNKCRSFVTALKEHTNYGGYDLKWIADRFNQIVVTIQQSAVK